jgi:hypothetical protein
MASRSISCSIQRALEMLGSAVSDVQEVLRDAAPGSTSGDEAKAFVDLFAQAERAAASGIALYAPRVVETGAHAKDGHGSAAEWLAAAAGSSSGVAKSRLAAATRATGDEALSEALHGGDLSSSQLKLMGDTEAAAPGSAKTLVELAEAGASHQELSDAASRLSGAARSTETERTRRARVHERRHLRWHQCPEGGVRGTFSCDEVQWATVAPRLEARAKGRWKAAGSTDPTTLEAYRLDVFIDLMAGGGVGGRTDGAPEADPDSDADPDSESGGRWGSNSGPRVETLVLIDAAALRRGTTQGDEICEIEGIGPVSVAAATELLGEGGLQYLVREGFDIKTVTKSTRVVTQCIDMALLVRDRTCVVPGCGRRLGLERDHVHVDYAKFGPTELKNLARLCVLHHDLKTHGGWRLTGGPGHWGWIAPLHPPSAGRIARNRRLVAARGKANADRKRKTPRRT